MRGGGSRGVGVDSAGREQVHDVDATCNVQHSAALACWELAVAAVAEGDVMAWVGVDESRCVCVRVRVRACACVCLFWCSTLYRLRFFIT